MSKQMLRDDQGASEEKGEMARLTSFVGAIAVADLVKSTLGPKGMDKILQSMSEGGKVTITNDGATILKSIPIDNAAAKILVDISKTQDAVVGDGTTSVVVLAGEFLREAEKLINMKIHPQTVIRGYRKGLEAARAALEGAAVNNIGDQGKFREDLYNIARTTLSSKILHIDNEKFANLAVEAVLRLRGSTNLDSIHIVKKVGGSLKDSYLDSGFILDKKMGVGQPKRIENAKIMLANTPMDTDKIKIYGARVKADGFEKVAEIEDSEKAKMQRKVEKICSHGPNVFINRQLIYNYPEQLFADKGVMAIEHADFEGCERLALFCGAEIVSTFDGAVTLGQCDLIEEIMIGEDKVLRFSGSTKNEACTIVLRGASQHILDEAERSLHDALCVLSQTASKENRTLLGGGCSEMLMSTAVDEESKKVAGKEAMAVEAFARALRGMPTALADNAGFDSIELVAQLRAAHFAGNHTAGLDMNRGCVGDVAALKITESYQVKYHVLVSAHEACEMILRVDEIIKCAPRRRE